VTDTTLKNVVLVLKENGELTARTIAQTFALIKHVINLMVPALCRVMLDEGVGFVRTTAANIVTERALYVTNLVHAYSDVNQLFPIKTGMLVKHAT